MRGAGERVRQAAQSPAPRHRRPHRRGCRGGGGARPPAAGLQPLAPWQDPAQRRRSPPARARQPRRHAALPCWCPTSPPAPAHSRRPRASPPGAQPPSGCGWKRAPPGEGRHRGASAGGRPPESSPTAPTETTASAAEASAAVTSKAGPLLSLPEAATTGVSMPMTCQARSMAISRSKRRRFAASARIAADTAAGRGRPRCSMRGHADENVAERHGQAVGPTLRGPLQGLVERQRTAAACRSEQARDARPLHAARCADPGAIHVAADDGARAMGAVARGVPVAGSGEILLHKGTPRNAGCKASIPESITATVTPRPVQGD